MITGDFSNDGQLDTLISLNCKQADFFSDSNEWLWWKRGFRLIARNDFMYALNFKKCTKRKAI